MSSDKLFHYGTPRHSGRYPWGSGENPYQRSRMFMSRVNELRAQGYTDKEIVDKFGNELGIESTGQLRAQRTIANGQIKSYEMAHIRQLKEKGYSNIKIAEMTGVSEATVRNYLKDDYKVKATKTQELADVLKSQVEDLTYLDVGKGVEVQLGVSREQLNAAVQLLQEEGYTKHYLSVEQVTNEGKKTSVQVLTKNDISWSEANENMALVRSPKGVYYEDFGRTKRDLEPPVSIDSSRIQIKYNEEGGVDKDGVIELRPGVQDISLGDNRYAQVRIAVDDTHYLKGMAVYNNHMPDGVDIIFNTNKAAGTPKEKVFKELEDDPENPFGSTIRRQRHYVDENGVEHLSAINIVNDDKEWGKWQKTLSSQFLSKQTPQLAKRQLDITYDDYMQQYEDILRVTQPTVKRKLLESFAEDCDSAAVHLKAKGMPNQNVQVILPVTSLKDNEVYAPNYKNGEEVVLIRYPHGGPFEIPRLIVNNKNREGNEVIGPDSKKAIGINKSVADKLSGADFDGDTVTVIPTKNQKIKADASDATRKRMGLANFDPNIYENPPGVLETKNNKSFKKPIEMGKVSNLITDMTIKGATAEEIGRAVKHSMVVIDAEKHNLDWKASESQNGIAELREKYQAKENGKSGGASTLISQAKSEVRVDARKDRYDIDPSTGKKIYNLTNETYEEKKTLKNPDGSDVFDDKGKPVKVKTGKVIKVQDKSTKMAETDDAYTLSSGTVIESVYADYANKMKALANTARKTLFNTETTKRNSSAAKTYKDEVDSLDAKLKAALLNAPKERQAQMIANTWVKEKKESNPQMTEEDESKLRSQSLDAARRASGTTRRQERQISITDREWEAIQAGAISENKLSAILSNTDLSEIQKRATPRQTTGIPASTLSRARTLLNAGYTWAEVSESVGVPQSTLQKEI